MEGYTVKYEDNSYALHTDLYQINMMMTYFREGIHERNARFELFFRKNPFGSGYAVFAGLQRIIEYIKQLKFSENDLAYLRELGYPEDFLSYLSNFSFTGNIQSVHEGEIVFANEPIIQIEGKLAECQLIETALLNIVNFQTLIATKASRIRYAVGNGGQLISEFGTRRAHELDAALWGTRAAYIAGFDSTSNVRAGKLFDMPISGTHAHAMVQVYGDEYAAFTAYAKTHKRVVFLVDTYDTLKSGVPTAIKVAKEFGDKIDFYGIRLDSGKMAYLSQEARKMLDEAGFTKTKIFASNDLDEYTIIQLKKQGAKIDAWGVGTKLITAYDQPALGAVYKVVAIENANGEMEDTIKLSENPEKVTTPGCKNVYRIVNNGNGMWEGDYIALEKEAIDEEAPLTMFHPVYTYIRKYVTNFKAELLLQPVFMNGELLYEERSVKESRDYCEVRLKHLWDDYRHEKTEAEYPVDLSQECWDNKMEFIHNLREKIQRKS
jgi:nicotinate phosphoribosyltransferase